MRSTTALLLVPMACLGCDDGPTSPASTPPASPSVVASSAPAPAPTASASARPPRIQGLVDRSVQLPETSAPLSDEEAERWITPAEKVRVELVARGEPPHQAYRYRGDVGDHGAVVMELRSNTVVEGKSGAVAPAAPPMLVALELRVTAVAEGALTLAIEVRKWGIDGEGPEAKEAEEVGATLAGKTCSWTIASRGALAPPAPPSGISPAATQLWASVGAALFDMAPPVPADAIGAGARWRVLDRTVRGGVPMLRLSTFAAKGQEGGGWLLDGTVREVPLAVPPAPPSPAFRLRVEDAAGAGKRRVALAASGPWPLAASTEIAADATIEAIPTVEGAEPTKAVVHLTELQTLLRADLDAAPPAPSASASAAP